MANFLTNIQYNYGQRFPHKLLEHKYIAKKTSYHPHEKIATVFYAVKKLLKFTDITRPSYTQHQSVNTTYVIINRMRNFALATRKWNLMPTLQKMWAVLNQFFRTTHHKLWDMTYVTIQDARMHHKNTVHDVVPGIQEVFQQ